VALFITEFWRDPEGRGSVLKGAIDAPQIAGVVLVAAGAFVLRDRPSQRVTSAHAAGHQSGHEAAHQSGARNE
jgi:hypothetical protein